MAKPASELVTEHRRSAAGAHPAGIDEHGRAQSITRSTRNQTMNYLKARFHTLQLTCRLSRHPELLSTLSRSRGSSDAISSQLSGSIVAQTVARTVPATIDEPPSGPLQTSVITGESSPSVVGRCQLRRCFASRKSRVQLALPPPKARGRTPLPPALPEFLLARRDGHGRLRPADNVSLGLGPDSGRCCSALAERELLDRRRHRSAARRAAPVIEVLVDAHGSPTARGRTGSLSTDGGLLPGAWRATQKLFRPRRFGCRGRGMWPRRQDVLCRPSLRGTVIRALTPI